VKHFGLMAAIILLFFAPAKAGTLVFGNGDRLQGRIERLENSNLVRWVTLNAYKIFWSCLILSLSFKTFNVVDQLKANRKNRNLKMASSEGLENLEWWEIVIENYLLTLICFTVVYFLIRIRKRKKGLI